MNYLMKTIAVFVFAFLFLTGCSVQQQTSTDEKIPYGGINPSLTVSVDSSSQDYTNGNDNNFFYTFWKDKEEKGGFPANQGTAFMYTWMGTPGYGAWAFCNNAHGIVGGRGWTSGKVNLSVTLHGWAAFYADQDGVDDDGYFGVYGWADNNWDSSHPERLIEYYIIEQHGTKDHGRDNDGDAGTYGGSITSDGSTYYLYKTRRVYKPSIRGWVDFDQYWSVRSTQRNSGTITFSNHVNGWGYTARWTKLTDSMMNKDGTYQIAFVEAPFDNNTGSGNGFAYIDSFSGR